jgi:hypothetical protein
VIYEIVWSLAERVLSRDEIRQVYEVAREVLTWEEARALDACPSQTRALLEEWAQLGRVGEAAATVIELRLRPADLQDATTRTGLDEHALLEWLTRCRQIWTRQSALSTTGGPPVCRATHLRGRPDTSTVTPTN